MPAPSPKSVTRRDATVNLRLPERMKALIDEAAARVGKTRTEFMIESARQHATDVLLDQRLFELPPGQWDAFVAALEAPPAPNPALKRLMAKRPPWAGAR